MSFSNFIIIHSPFLSFLSSILLAIITFYYVILTYKMLNVNKLQYIPLLTTDIFLSKKKISNISSNPSSLGNKNDAFICLFVENIGKGDAFGIEGKSYIGFYDEKGNLIEKENQITIADRLISGEKKIINLLKIKKGYKQIKLFIKDLSYYDLFRKKYTRVLSSCVFYYNF